MPAPPKARTLLILAGTAVYWLVIFLGTHAPGSMIHTVGHTDKVYHFSAFFGLSMLLCSSAACYWRLGPVQFAAIVGLAAGYGIFDELTQMLVKNRSADSLDWFADVAGAIAGTLIFALMQRLFSPYKKAQGATG